MYIALQHALLVIPFANECIWFPRTAMNKLAEMIMLPFCKLYLLISYPLSFTYPLPLCVHGGNTSLSQQLVRFGRSLSDK